MTECILCAYLNRVTMHQDTESIHYHNNKTCLTDNKERDRSPGLHGKTVSSLNPCKYKSKDKSIDRYGDKNARLARLE